MADAKAVIDSLGGETCVRTMPRVSRIVTPYAIEMFYMPKKKGPLCYTKTRGCSRERVVFEQRLFSMNIQCNMETESHIFFCGLILCNKEEPSAGDVKRLCRVFNDPMAVAGIRTEHRLCNAPYFACVQTDSSIDEPEVLIITGLGYHCHCKEPFSMSCWQGVVSASARAAALCTEIRKRGIHKANV
uniref:UL55 n=1 Tax=anatid alphaherpesvirus 1 TaxID=104388 RepID=A9QXU9_9ALPH|nr:UL55 [Anatid alphaherpesvirus 1]